MVNKFKYNGKERCVVVFHEAKDEKGNVIKFDGIDTSYMEPEEAQKCQEFFKDLTPKPFPQKGEKAEKIENANSEWFKHYRHFLSSKIEK
jgi:hypothetical protein